jgi:hypothetical protein
MANSSTAGFVTSLAGAHVSGWNAAAGTINPNGSANVSATTTFVTEGRHAIG